MTKRNKTKRNSFWELAVGKLAVGVPLEKSGVEFYQAMILWGWLFPGLIA